LAVFEQHVKKLLRAWFACAKHSGKSKSFFRAKPATLGRASVAVRKQPRQDPLAGRIYAILGVLPARRKNVDNDMCFAYNNIQVTIIVCKKNIQNNALFKQKHRQAIKTFP
jgi:hypothetical protein